jgi:hypothetical protein
MAALTIVQTGVAKDYALPIVCVVAVSTAVGKMIPWRVVALGAIGQALVRDTHLRPGGCEVAAAAITRIVAIWQNVAVTACAVGLPGMVECNLLPGCF